MSSYNNVEKIKYASEDCVVTLREYIVFEDERREEKYVVFKFANNISQQLLGMEFEVSQYDIDNNLVEKSVVVYNKFLAKPAKEFVPKAKLKVNYACKTLSVRLIQAAFDRFIWKEGQYLDNSYKFEHYSRDEDIEAAKRTPPAQAVAVKPQKPAPAPKRRKGKMPFTAKNTTRKNIARFPGVFNFFVCILVFVAIGLSIYFFSSNSTAFTLENFGLKIIDKGANTVAVTGYEGKETDLTVPATIGEYKVVRISENAFKNSSVTSVKFNSNLTYIESCAFEGCKNLKTVSSTAEVTVSADAFKNCTQLENLTLPNAVLLSGSLNGCTGVTYLQFKTTTARTLSELFAGNAPKTPPTIVTDGDIPGGGEQDGSGSSFEYDPEEYYDYGYLADKGVKGYQKYDDFETVNGEIITINPNASPSLVIPEEVNGINYKVYPQLYIFNSLTVKGNTPIESDAASYFKNVTSLDVNYGPSVSTSLMYFFYLKVASLPCYKDAPIQGHQYYFNLKQPLEKLVLKPTAECTKIPDGAFNGLSVKEIVVAEGFKSCGMDIVEYNYDLVAITLPKGVTYGDFVIGYNCYNLVKVDVSFDDIITNYSRFNQSCDYTNELIIRTQTLDYNDFMAGLNYIETLEIHADSATQPLTYFLTGGYGYFKVDNLKISSWVKDNFSFLDGIEILELTFVD